MKMIDSCARATALAACILLMVGGCASRTVVSDSVETRDYPENAEYGPDLDIVVVRHPDTIQLINRTPHHHDDLELWLNQQYVSDIDRIAIGTDNRMPLSQFINAYRETYPTGSFLRPDRSERLVLAELYDRERDLRYRLVVQPPGTR